MSTFDGNPTVGNLFDLCKMNECLNEWLLYFLNTSHYQIHVIAYLFFYSKISLKKYFFQVTFLVLYWIWRRWVKLSFIQTILTHLQSRQKKKILTQSPLTTFFWNFQQLIPSFKCSFWFQIAVPKVKNQLSFSFFLTFILFENNDHLGSCYDYYSI